jgi:Protein kinase domain
MRTDVGDLVGRTLAGRYRVVRPIGRGGMGVVYEAVQLDLERRVALKVLLDSDARALARFRQEALSTANLASPHIVTVSDLCEPPDAPPFLVMELLEGEPLGRLLSRERLVSATRAVGIAGQVLSALAVAHAQGIVHRDIKPANVFLVKTATSDDFIKVLDFGIAKVESGGVKTTTGAIVGTPAYLAPEQILGGDVGPWTDTRAVGVLLYEMLSGARPWPGKDPLVAVLTEPPAPLGGVPDALAALVMRALADDAKERFRTADEMLAALRALDGPRGPAPSRTSTSARWPLFAVGFAVPLVLGIAGALLLVRAAATAPLTEEASAPATEPPVDAATATLAEEDVPDGDLPDSDIPAAATTSRPSLDRECSCVVTMSGSHQRVLCLAPRVPRCRCEREGMDLCEEPVDPAESVFTRCRRGYDSWGGPGKKTGDACTGRGHQNELVDGNLWCNFCYGVEPYRDAVQGSRCRGVFMGDSTADLATGHWECGKKRPR